MPDLADDPSIVKDALLWRRVPPWHFVQDDNDGGRIRSSSAAFDDDKDGDPMSVVLGTDLLASGRKAEEALAGHDGFALTEFTAGLAREAKLGVARFPTTEEPCHAKVFGKKTQGVKKRLEGSRWRIPPPAQGP